MISFGRKAKRAGDADALALAAREFVRIALHLVGRQADALEQRGDALAALRAREPMPWISSGSATRSPTAHARIERGVGVLEDHLHVAAHRLARARGRARRDCGRRSRCRRRRAPGRPAPWRSSTCRSRTRRPAPASRSAAIEKQTPSTACDAAVHPAEEAAAHVEADVQVADRRRPAPACPVGAGLRALRAARRRRCAARRRAARAYSRPSGVAKMSATVPSSTMRPCAHDDDPVGHLGDHAHVVGDQDDRWCRARAAGRAAAPAPRPAR